MSARQLSNTHQDWIKEYRAIHRASLAEAIDAYNSPDMALGDAPRNSDWQTIQALKRSNDDLLAALQAAYNVLGDCMHHWPGRDTLNGQKLLIDMRDAISAATGRDPCDVSSSLSAPFVRAAIQKATT